MTKGTAAHVDVSRMFHLSANVLRISSKPSPEEVADPRLGSVLSDDARPCGGLVRFHHEGMGYSRIPLFGEYLASPDTSLCFGKTL
jgi:hypothetical protein